MKLTSFVALFLGLGALAFAENRPDAKVEPRLDPVAENRYQENVAKIVARLNAMENLYFKYLTQQERLEAIRLMNETRTLVVERPAISDRRREDEKPKVDPNLLNDAGFSALYESVKNELSDASKTKLILALGKNGKITTVQLEKLVQLYRFDSDKKELIKAIANNIVDPVNVAVVIRRVDSPFVQEELAKFFRDR